MAGQIDILLGGPGSGKTEQARRLESTRGYVHLSTGALLRASDDPAIKATLNKGELTATDEVQAILLKAIKAVDINLPILLDGFPRLKSEADWLVKTLPGLKRTIGQVILINISKNESIKRLSVRHRADDSPAAIEQRWHDFKHKLGGVTSLFESKELLQEVDGSGLPEDVAARIENLL